MKQCFKQKGPTCSIYAFLNGLCYSKKSLKQSEIDFQASQLLELAIERGYSFVGEFFSSEVLKSFLLDQRHYEIQKIEEIANLPEQLDVQENQFLLVPIYTFKDFRKQRLHGMHWLVVVPEKDHYVVLDVSHGTTKEISDLIDLAQYNQLLCSKYFDWCLWQKKWTLSFFKWSWYNKFLFYAPIRRRLNRQLMIYKECFAEKQTKYTDTAPLLVTMKE